MALNISQRGLALDGKLHFITIMHDDDLSMAFFKNPGKQILARMQEAPKAYSPQATTH